MEKALAREIKDTILARNALTFKNAFSILRQLQNGKVVEWLNDEGKPIGLTDSIGNYFYIRYLDEPDISEPTERTTSCEEKEYNVKLRLFAWVLNGDKTKLAEVLMHDLLTPDFSGLDNTESRRYSKIYPIQIVSVITNEETIMKDETLLPDDKIKRKKYATILAIDFNLRFNYKPYAHPDLCLDRNICVPCL